MTSHFGFQSPAAERFPSIVVLENTNVCNLRCIHCPQGQIEYGEGGVSPVYMDWEIYKKAIDEIALHETLLLRFSPEGEALVHPQFLDQVAYAKAKGITPLDLTTNGLNLDNPAIENGQRIPGKTILDRLLELGLDIIDISVDAFYRDSYEGIRVGSNYHRLYSSIHRLLYQREKVNAPTKVMLSIIDQPESHDEVEKFVDYWSRHVDRVLVRPYLENLGLTPSKPNSVVDKIGETSRWPCPQFWKRITIGPDGSLRFCVVDIRNRSLMGNLAETSIEELWSGAEYQRLREEHLKGCYSAAHSICGPCTDWLGMRWDWGFERAVGAVMGDTTVPDKPPAI